MSSALVFSGGGGKGAYEVGVWKGIRESGLEDSFKSVVGTSVGALNAVLFGQQNMDTAIRIWEEISYNKMLLPNIGGRGALSSQDGLKNLLQANLTGDLKKNVYVCCSRIESERGIWDEFDYFQPKSILGIDMDERVFAEYFKLNDFSKDRQIDYLLASSALPAVYDAVYIDGKKYRDGGIIKEHNMPYEKAVKLGFDKVLAVGLEYGSSGLKKIQNSKVYILNPSESLGDVIDGTIDFDARNVRWRMDLGYKDFMEHKKDILSDMKEELICSTMPNHIRDKLRKMV